MRKDLQCGMVGVSWSILDRASWSDRKWLPSDQLNPVFSTENAIFGPTSPDGTKFHVMDSSVKNAFMQGLLIKLVSCQLLF